VAAIPSEPAAKRDRFGELKGQIKRRNGDDTKSSKSRSFHEFIATYSGRSNRLRDLSGDLRSDAEAPKTDEELRDYLNRFPFIVKLGVVDAAWRAYRRATRRM
jgi:hypothetical protein